MRTYIFAGTFEQARNYAGEYGLNRDEWNYVSRVHELRGLIMPSIVLYGTYRLRHDFAQLREMCEVLGWSLHEQK